MNYIESINGNINPLKIKDLNIKLKGRNLIIIGANGAGKTRFLSFFNTCLERHEIYNKVYLSEKIKTELVYLIHSYKNTLDLNEDDFSLIKKIRQSDENEFMAYIQKFNSDLLSKYNIFLRDKNIFNTKNKRMPEDYYYTKNIPDKTIEKIFHYSNPYHLENSINSIQSYINFYQQNKENLKIALNKNTDIDHFFYDASRVFSIPKSIKDYNKMSKKNKIKIKDPTESLESFLLSQKKNLEDELARYNKNKSITDTDYNDNISLFKKIENDLKVILEDDSTELSFDKASNRVLIIQKNGESFFKFDSLSSGFKAIFIIYADLLMRAKIKKVKPEEINAVVIIDEIDVHLHISLQKKVLPFFVKAFPNIQFIVSTHSPFVITSTNNDTVVYDISSGEFFEEDLSLYSHESIIKELFHVKDESENLKQLSNQLLQFINSENSTQDLNVIQGLLNEINKDFEKLSVELQLQYMVAKNKLAKLKHEGN